MTDDLGIRRSGRRRRTTRRLARQPIRVPGDNVPRQSLSMPEEEDDEYESQEQDEAASEDRPSADQIDVEVDVDAAHSMRPPEPTSGVVHMPPPRASAPPPPPPMAAKTDPPRPPDVDDTKTNPQIRLADLAARRSSLPPPVRAAEQERDEPTRPRIELTVEMAKAAGRVSSEDADIDTNPRISIPPAEPAPAAVVVTRARVISDRPTSVVPAPHVAVPPSAVPVAARESVPPPAPRSSRRPSARPPSGDIEVIDSLEIDVGDVAASEPPPADSARAGSVSPTPGRLSDVASRSSKAPPPPPDGPAKPALRKPAGPGGSSVAPTPSVSAKAPPPPPPSAAPKKPASKTQPRRRQWWDDFFSDDYLHSVPTLTPAQISRQVDFIESCLSLPKGSAILDVGCGLGHHSLELARRGYLVVGLDLSLPMITRAAEAAQQEGLRISFLHADMREMGFQAMFDGVVCVGTTFGFFDEDANRDTLLRLATALRPGGKLLLDVVNRDYVVRSQPNLVWFQGEGCVVMEESDFNFFSSRLTVKRTMMREDGRQSDAEYSLRLYSLHELGQMLQQVGFRVNEVSGQEATRGIFFGGESAHIILLAERRAAKGGNGAPASERGPDEPPTGEIPKLG